LAYAEAYTAAASTSLVLLVLMLVMVMAGSLLEELNNFHQGRL
jgi:hypothetical protein